MHREVGECSDSRSRISFVTCIPRALSRVNHRTSAILASIQTWLTGGRVSVSDSTPWSSELGMEREHKLNPLTSLYRNRCCMAEGRWLQISGSFLMETLAIVCGLAYHAELMVGPEIRNEKLIYVLTSWWRKHGVLMTLFYAVVHIS